MAAVNKIDSNVTELRIAEETSIGVLPGTPDWLPLEPNTYPDFGGSVSQVSRNPINADRQRKKGVITDLDAQGGFQTDLTQSNLQEILQGFFYASLITKDELAVATVDGINDDFEPASGGDGYTAGDLLFAKGFDDDGNNGLHVVSGVPTATSVPVTSDLVAGTTQDGTISKVGRQYASGDVSVDVAGTLPKLVSAVDDFTTLGLTPGDWIFIGGDLAAEQFANAENNGFARVRSVTTSNIELDKTSATMVTDAGTGKTIRLFVGRLLKNQTGTGIVRRTYQLERQLGAPDDALPSQIQSQYLTGAVPNTCQFNFSQADKVTVDLAYVATDDEQRTGATGVKSGNRPALQEADAFNTSSDVSRINMSQVVTGNPFPTPLFAFLTELTISINNNLSPAKAVGRLGAFEVTAGSFEVGGSLTAYFADVAAVSAVRNNQDITLDVHLAKQNSGITIDVPLITLGDGKPNVEQDQPITLPLEMAAATGAKIDASLNHTLAMVFWDYLPTAAE